MIISLALVVTVVVCFVALGMVFDNINVLLVDCGLGEQADNVDNNRSSDNDHLNRFLCLIRGDLCARIVPGFQHVYWTLKTTHFGLPPFFMAPTEKR